MNIAKNMEFVFIIAVALTCASAYAAPRTTSAAYNSQVSVGGAKMARVVITGKRLTPAQKAQLGM